MKKLPKPVIMSVKMVRLLVIGTAWLLRRILWLEAEKAKLF